VRFPEPDAVGRLGFVVRAVDGHDTRVKDQYVVTSAFEKYAILRALALEPPVTVRH
jgi:hypothetical protein